MLAYKLLRSSGQVIPTGSWRRRDIVVSASVCVCMYVCMYACMHACMHACMYVFYCLHDNSKNMEQSAPNVWTLRTLGQHEFAFGFCGSTTTIVAGDPCSLSALVNLLFTMYMQLAYILLFNHKRAKYCMFIASWRNYQYYMYTCRQAATTVG